MFASLDEVHESYQNQEGPILTAIRGHHRLRKNASRESIFKATYRAYYGACPDHERYALAAYRQFLKTCLPPLFVVRCLIRKEQ